MMQPYRFADNKLAYSYYWDSKAGQKLLKKLDAIPSLDKSEKLIPYLYNEDKDTDQILQDIYSNNGINYGNESLKKYLNDDQTLLFEKTTWDNFFNKIELEPSWLDKNKIKIGGELCRRTGLTGFIILRDYCLMIKYGSSAINKPNKYLRSLKHKQETRLADALTFWVQVIKENSLEKNGEGFKQVFFARITNAYNRTKILEKTDWDSEKWGIPYNSWDMLANNLGFSIVFLIGLKKIGIKPSKNEIDGLFHLWKYIGYLLGIPSTLLCNDEKEAIEALYLWSTTQRPPDEDSIALAFALKNEPVNTDQPNSILFKKMMREIHLYYNHYLLGADYCKILGLPNTTIGRYAMVNIWRIKESESKIIDEESRLAAVQQGSDDQERIRLMYEKNNI